MFTSLMDDLRPDEAEFERNKVLVHGRMKHRFLNAAWMIGVCFQQK